MDPAVLREDMVEGLEHPSKEAVRSDRVGLAMREVPRHEFVDDEREAYLDRRFEHRGATVLAPSMAARLVEALAPEPEDSVLVVGAGVGYTAAVLAELVGPANVHAVDIDRGQVLDARSNLADAGYAGVLVDRRDGAEGLPEYAPFDRVLVEAAAVNPPAALLDQLSPGGRLVLPLGGADQTLAAVEADSRGQAEQANGGQADVADPPADAGPPDDAEPSVVEEFGPVAFQPLLVEGEQASSVERNRTAREDREFAARAQERRRGWEQDWIDWENAGWDRRREGLRR